MPKPEFTETERRILALAGDTLSRSATPFADIADAVGVQESQVVELLARLKDEGVMRRFGATLRHQKAGYGHNAMVAWKLAPDADVDGVGEKMAARPEISHCYRRRTYPEWRYDLYTMIHGKNPGDCMRVAEELAAETGVAEFAVLNSIQELKKSSMKYF